MMSTTEGELDVEVSHELEDGEVQLITFCLKKLGLDKNTAFYV